MAKEGNRASEQIFLVHFQDRALLNSSLPLATPGRSESDYFALDALQQMTSSMSRLPILVTVLRDDLTEGPEVFLLRSGSSTDSINTILFEKPINLYSETVVIIQDRGFDCKCLICS